MTEPLSPVDEAHVNRIVDAIIARSREEIRAQALRDAADAAAGMFAPSVVVSTILALIDAPPASLPKRAENTDLRDAVAIVNGLRAKYQEPTDWDYGALDGLHVAEKAILALIDGPAPEKAEITPDPNDEDQVGAVALALFEMDKVNWIAPDYSQHENYMRDWARRTLGALQALALARAR